MGVPRVIGVDLSGGPAAVAGPRAGRGGWAGALVGGVEGAGGFAGVARRVRNAIRRFAIDGAEVAICLGNGRTHVSALDLPPRASGAPIDDLAREEMARLFRLEPGSFEMASWDGVGSSAGGGGTSVLAVAVEHATAHELIGEFEKAGLGVRAIEASCVVMSSLAREARACVLNLAWDAAEVVVVEGERPVVERSWAEGGASALASALRAALGADAREAARLIEQAATGDALPARAMGVVESHARSIARETRASLEYAERRLPGAGSSVVIGAGAWMASVGAALEREGVASWRAWEEGPGGPRLALACACARRWA